jgi:hypothetical protein
VRFHESPEAGFYEVGGGVAFVQAPRRFRHSHAEDLTTVPSIGKRRYAWPNVALGDGLMLVLVLPEGYTIELNGDTSVPQSAKEFRGRLAVYYRPQGSQGASVSVSWEIKPIVGSVEGEAERIRMAGARRSSTNFGVWVDNEGGEPAPRALSGGALAGITLLAGLLGVGLLFFYVHWVPKLVSFETQAQIFYILLIPWGLLSSVVLVGGMRSYAHFTYKEPRVSVELGGGAAIFFLILVGGFRLVPPQPERSNLLVPPQPERFDLTVRPSSADGRDPVIRSGKITIDLGNDRRTEMIDPAGEANFKSISLDLRRATLRVLPQVDGYEQQWQECRITDNVLNLSLVRIGRPGGPTPTKPRSDDLASLAGKWVTSGVVGDCWVDTPECAMPCYQSLTLDIEGSHFGNFDLSLTKFIEVKNPPECAVKRGFDKQQKLQVQLRVFDGKRLELDVTPVKKSREFILELGYDGCSLRAAPGFAEKLFPDTHSELPVVFKRPNEPNCRGDAGN